MILEISIGRGRTNGVGIFIDWRVLRETTNYGIKYMLRRCMCEKEELRRRLVKLHAVYALLRSTQGLYAVYASESRVRRFSLVVIR